MVPSHVHARDISIADILQIREECDLSLSPDNRVITGVKRRQKTIAS